MVVSSPRTWTSISKRWPTSATSLRCWTSSSPLWSVRSSRQNHPPRYPGSACRRSARFTNRQCVRLTTALGLVLGGACLRSNPLPRYRLSSRPPTSLPSSPHRRSIPSRMRSPSVPQRTNPRPASRHTKRRPPGRAECHRMSPRRACLRSSRLQRSRRSSRRRKYRPTILRPGLGHRRRSTINHLHSTSSRNTNRRSTSSHNISRSTSSLRCSHRSRTLHP